MTSAVYPSLRDRVAFVSGGATGLGAEFVAALAAQGTRVAFVDIDEPAARRLVEDVAAAGHPRPLFLPCDVADIPALQQAIAATHDELGPISVLVNNAANDRRQRVADVDVAAWDASFAVNVRHHFFAAQAVAAQMRALGGGSVINLGSISAHIDLVDLPSYITAKAGVEGLTRTLARELGPDRIRVNCIIPGWVMTERQLRDWVTPEAEESIRRNQCLTEPVMPVDVARMLLWLAADDSRMCTAQTWVVDGGWM
ncbi:SDR family oxidoreductase [Microlunatus spumicola]|uniref:SDR family oxidoreductase n=1 Tax=Microlunatus spumicola TaxID=81499 RepID=A0ABP6WZ07_9ACTN